MAKFLSDSDLNSAIENLIKVADSIFLVSPFIRLHERIKRHLLDKKGNPNFEIKVLFGKNFDDPSQSLNPQDLEFFKDFLNVDIRYKEQLHAKYYSNGLDAILTSMNLYSYSQNNNIEFGVLLKPSILQTLVGSGDGRLDTDANDYFLSVFNQAELLFKKTPRFEKTMLGLNQKYVDSKIDHDKTGDFFIQKAIPQLSKPFSEPKTVQIEKRVPNGFCIRTGKSIQFNPKKPMSDEAFTSWSKFSNPDYPEKFCHFSGETSNGETTFSKPILKKNWTKAKETHQF